MAIISHTPYKRTYRSLVPDGSGGWDINLPTAYDLVKVSGKFSWDRVTTTDRYRVWYRIYFNDNSTPTMEHNAHVVGWNGGTLTHGTIDATGSIVSNPWCKLCEYVDETQDVSFEIIFNTISIHGTKGSSDGLGSRAGIIGDLNYTIGAIGSSKTSFSSHATNHGNKQIDGFRIDCDWTTGAQHDGRLDITVEGLRLKEF